MYFKRFQDLGCSIRAGFVLHNEFPAERQSDSAPIPTKGARQDVFAISDRQKNRQLNVAHDGLKPE
jgi:hypothetical protein